MKRVAYVAVLATVAPAIAHAGAVEHLDYSLSKVGAAVLASPVSPSSGYEVTAQQGDSNVTMKLSRSIGRFAIASGADSGTGTGYAWSLTAQAPLSKSGSSTTIGTLDGLANASSLEFKLTHVSVNGIKVDSVGTLRHCKQDLVPKYLAGGAGRKESDFNCDSGFISKKMPDELDEFQRYEYTEDSSIVTWGASGKVAYKDFDYFDATDLSKQTSRKSPWSAGAFISYVPPSADRLFSASYKVQQSYEDAKSKTLCPAATSTFAECASGPIGVPSEKRKQLLTAEGRMRVSSKLAIALSATRDFKNKVTGVQLPIYFVGDGSGGLTGGLRLDWSSESHKSSVGLFVGQVFKLLD